MTRRAAAGDPGTPPSRGVLRSMGVLGGGTVLAAVLGLGFQSLLAYWFGAGAETDAWFMSLSIFAFLAKFLMLGHLKSLTLPAYARLREVDPARADALAGGLFRLSLAALGALTAVVLLGAPLLVDLLAPGYQGEIRSLTVALVRIRVPGLLFLGAITVGIAVLESAHRFGATVSAQKVVPAAVSLLLLLAVGDRLGMVAVGWVGLASTVAGAAVVLWAARGLVPPTPLAEAARDPEVRAVGRSWLRFSGSNAATFLGEWAFRVGASLLPVGLFSAVLYGRMVHDLLHGAVNDAAQAASLPRFARLAAVGAGEGTADAEARLGSGLRTGMAGLVALNLPVALFVAMMAPWIVAVLFGRGRFLEDGMLVPAAGALALFAAGFLVQGLVQLVFAAAFAADRSRLVNRVQIVGHLVRAAALVPLVRAFSWAGLVGAQVGMNVLVLALLVAGAPRRWALLRNAAVLRGVAAAAPAALLHAFLVAPLLPDPLALGEVARFAVLAAVAAGWAAVTVPAALAARVPGLAALVARLVPGRVAVPAVAAVLGGGALALPGALDAQTLPGTDVEATPPSTAAALSAAPLPDDHPALALLEWLEARGAVPAGTTAFRPLGGDRVAALLSAAAGAGGADGALAAAALRRLADEAWGRGRARVGAGAGGVGGDAGARLEADLSAGAGRAYAWAGALGGGGEPALRRGGVGVRVGPVDVGVGRRRLTLGGGASGAVVANPSAPVDGLLVHTPAPLDVPVLGPLRVALGLGPVAGYRAVDGPWLGVLRLTARPAPWIQVGLSRGALVGGSFDGGRVPYDPVPIPPDRGSLSAADVLSILAGKTTLFDDQVAAVDVRVSLASLGLPALAYAETGWEDADRSWGDPGLVAGLLLAPSPDAPVAFRYEYAAFGAGARLCGWCDTLPAFWYRHNRFQDGWVSGGRLLGHPLGGYGSQHRIAASGWSPGAGARAAAHVDRLRRDRWNVLFDERPGSAWAGGAEVAWRPRPGLEVAGAWSGEWGGEGEGLRAWSLLLRWLPGARGPGGPGG